MWIACLTKDYFLYFFQFLYYTLYNRKPLAPVHGQMAELIPIESGGGEYAHSDHTVRTVPRVLRLLPQRVPRAPHHTAAIIVTIMSICILGFVGIAHATGYPEDGYNRQSTNMLVRDGAPPPSPPPLPPVVGCLMICG